MNWKNRLTNYNFWISIVSAVLLILQAFDINFDIAYINEIVTAVLGLLVVIGIINDPTKNKETYTTENSTIKDEVKEKDINVDESVLTDTDIMTSNSNAIEQSSDTEEILVDEVKSVNNQCANLSQNVENVDKSIPFDEQDENADGVNQDDFEVLIKRIENDIVEKLTASLKVCDSVNLVYNDENVKYSQNDIRSLDTNMPTEQNLNIDTENKNNSNNNYMNTDNIVSSNKDTCEDCVTKIIEPNVSGAHNVTSYNIVN